MADDSKLFRMAYDEDGNLGYGLDDNSNIECTDRGLEYTGIIRPRLAENNTVPVLDCTPRTNCDCGPIARDVNGDIWAPPPQIYNSTTVLSVIGNANLTLPAGGFWTSPIESHTTTAFNDCDNVYAIYNAYFQVTMTDPPVINDFTITANNTNNVICWDGISDTNTAGGPDIFRMSGQFAEGIEILPGGSGTFDFFFSVNTSADNDSAFGVFEYRIRIIRHLFRNFTDCDAQILGGSALV